MSFAARSGESVRRLGARSGVRTLSSPLTISTVRTVAPSSQRAETRLRLLAVDDRRHREHPAARIHQDRVAVERGEQRLIGAALRVLREDLRQAELRARHAERDKPAGGLPGGVGDVLGMRRQVVDADRRLLAAAADAPVEVFLQPEEDDEVLLREGRERDLRAGDERADVRDGRVHRHLHRALLEDVLRQPGPDPEIAGERPGEPRSVEEVRPGREKVQPDHLVRADLRERLLREVPADVALLRRELPREAVDRRRARRAPVEEDLRQLLQVAAELVHRVRQALAADLLPEEPPEPRRRDPDYRHSGTSRSQSMSPS